MPNPENYSEKLWLWIDSCASCNLSCKLCYTAPMQNSSVMHPDTLSAVLNEVVSSNMVLQALHLNWRGEPTMNPLFHLLLERAERILRGYPIQWHTNGTLLIPSMAEMIADAHSNQTIYFSIDGGTESSFDRNRGQGQWQEALTNLRFMLRLRDARPHLKISVYSIDLGIEREHYDTCFSDLLDEVDSFTLVRPIRVDGGTRKGAGGASSLATDRTKGPCFWLGNALGIDTEGVAHSCLLSSGFPLGDVSKEGLTSIVGKARNARRRVEIEGRGIFHGCARCRKEEGEATADGIDQSAYRVPRRNSTDLVNLTVQEGS